MMRRDQGHEAGVTFVELLVVMVLMGIIGAATTGVVVSTLRTEQFQGEMQAVMDDGRISLQRIRGEVRAARQVMETSCQDTTACAPSSRLHFWVDQNQDQERTTDEIICYLTEPLDPTDPEQHQLVRWTEEMAGTPGCDSSTRPVDAQVIARTLLPTIDTDADGDADVAAPFIEFEPPPTADPSDPPTRNIGVLLRLQVVTGRDYEHLDVESIIRLRNVA